MEAREYRVEGMVQGVGFRWSARETALKIGVTGWVRNEPDGSVACRAQGDARQLADFENWLRRGPPGARVLRCTFVPVAVAGGISDFLILRED